MCCVHFLDQIQRVGNLNCGFEIIENSISPITRFQNYDVGLFRFLNLYYLSQFHFSKKKTTHYIMYVAHIYLGSALEIVVYEVVSENRKCFFLHICKLLSLLSKWWIYVKYRKKVYFFPPLIPTHFYNFFFFEMHFICAAVNYKINMINLSLF